MNMELLKLPNVRVAKDAGNIDEVRLQGDAKRLAWEVATKNPLWTIEVTSPRTFLVLCDKEKLGIIGSEWYGSNTKLFVRNDRIGANSTRKSAYHTDKVDTAVLKVKKTFGPLNLSALQSKAFSSNKRCGEIRLAKSLKISSTIKVNTQTISSVLREPYIGCILTIPIAPLEMLAMEINNYLRKKYLRLSLPPSKQTTCLP